MCPVQCQVRTHDTAGCLREETDLFWRRRLRRPLTTSRRRMLTLWWNVPPEASRRRAVPGVTGRRCLQQQAAICVHPPDNQTISTLCQSFKETPSVAPTPPPHISDSLLTRMAFIPEATPYTSPARRAAYVYSFKSSFSNLSNM